MHIDIYIYVYSLSGLSTCVNGYTGMFVCVCVYTFTYIHVCPYTLYIHIYVCLYQHALSS